MMPAIPLERFHDLSDLSDAGFDLTIVATPEERHRLADWAAVDDVLRLEAHVSVTPTSKTRFRLETDFVADVVQACVVTLEPVTSHIARSFTRELHLEPRLQRFADKGGLVPPAAAEDEAPDEIASATYDVAGPLREEFALAIDPYPRAPGVAFEAPADADAGDRPESPFAVLGKLKSAGSGRA
jgi:hypothetical protein